MNTRMSFFKPCSDVSIDWDSAWPIFKQYVLYPTSYIGGMSQNVGLTGFGLLKFFHFCFGKDKDLSDPEVLMTAIYFMFCTAGIIHRTRMPGLRENILKEQYTRKQEKKKISVTAVLKKHFEKCNSIETGRERFGNAVTLLLQDLSLFSGCLNLFNMLLNTATLYNYGYQLAYSAPHPDNMTGEEAFSVVTAITAGMVYFNFNIGSALEACEKVGNWIKNVKGTRLYENDDEYKIVKKAAYLLAAQAAVSPFFAYLSGHNALRQLPFGISDHLGISESFNVNFSIISSALFVITRTLSTGTSIYNFWKDRAHPEERDINRPLPGKWDKFITYFLGIGDCLGTAIGSMVAYCFLLDDFFGKVKHDKDHPFTFNHFQEEFPDWPWHLIAAALVGILNGGINYMFSVKGGLEKAVEVGSRLKDECKPLFFHCRRKRGFFSIQGTNYNADVISSLSNPAQDLKQPLVPKTNGMNGVHHHYEASDDDTPAPNYNPPNVRANSHVPENVTVVIEKPTTENVTLVIEKPTNRLT